MLRQKATMRACGFHLCIRTTTGETREGISVTHSRCCPEPNANARLLSESYFSIRPHCCAE